MAALDKDRRIKVKALENFKNCFNKIKTNHL